MNKLLKLPLVQYAGMDYDNIMSDLISIVKENPKFLASWGNFYDSDGGIVLTQMMAYLADNLSTKIDYLVNESWLSTASQDKNKLRLLKLINYRPSLAYASALKVKIELTKVIDILDNNYILLTPQGALTNYSTRLASIRKIVALDSNNAPITFEAISKNKTTGKYEYFKEVSIPATTSSEYTLDATGNFITLYQGETKQMEFSSSETDSVFFDIPHTNIIEGSITIYESVNGKEYLNVKSFIQREAFDEDFGIPYVISLNEDSTVRISFANEKILTNNKRRFPGVGTTLYIFYRIGGGEIGNIPISFLNINTNLLLRAGGSILANIFNETSGTGGENAETAEEAIINGPLAIRTTEKAVTPEDYDILLNKFPNILKVKTYSSVNMPTDFKEKYGRYLNPQEIFSFILLNKEHSSVPSSSYNYFPWIELINENRFNELYSFSNSSFNNPVAVTYLRSILKIVGMDSDIRTFKNFFIIETNENIKNNIYTSEGYQNLNFKIKITKTETDEVKLLDIPFDLIYTDPALLATSKTAVLSYDHPVVEADTNARYLANKVTNNAIPIDIFNMNKINFVLDDKGLITVDLLHTVTEPEKAKGKVYRYLSNPTPTDPLENFNWVGAQSEAVYRYGIVQMINNQFPGLAGSDELYNENNSAQYLGVGADSYISTAGEMAEIIVDPESFSVNFIIDINSYTYKFVFTNDLFDLAIDSLPVVEQQVAVATNILGISSMIEYCLATGENLFKLTGGAWVAEGLILGTNVGFKYELVRRFVDSNESLNNYNYFSSIDMLFYSKTIAGMTGGCINIDYTPSTLGGTNHSLVHTLAGENEFVEPVSFLPTPIKAADYSGCASIVDEKYLQIKSPLTGVSSTLYFVKSSSDFMYSYYNLDFLNAAGEADENALMSSKAYGVKRVTLLLKDQISTKINEEETETLSAGTIIYENNSIIFSSAIKNNIFYSYLLNDNKTIEIGSVYENYYNSGSSTTDELLKTKVSDLLGVSTEEGIVNIEKSNFSIKFSNNIQHKPSIYSIESDLDVIPVERIKLPTCEIETITSSAKLIFTVDVDSTEVDIEDYKIAIDLNSVLTNSSLLKAIKTKLDTNAFPIESILYKNFSNDIIRFSYETKKILIFGNTKKTPAGNITFYHDVEDSEEETKQLYLHLFGNSDSNPELYDLYGTYIPQGNRAIVGGTYSFYPTEEHPITFTFKKEKGNLLSSGDYYIDVIANEGVRTYNLIKTDDSKFQDKPFYLNFVNNRSGIGENITIEEQTVKEYISKYTISGMESSFDKPFFKTFDLKMTVTYNESYLFEEIRTNLESTIKKLYYIDERNIGENISKSNIIFTVMKTLGVLQVSIDYFGLDILSEETLDKVIPAGFNEIIVLHEDVYSGKEKIRGLIIIYEKG